MIVDNTYLHVLVKYAFECVLLRIVEDSAGKSTDLVPDEVGVPAPLIIHVLECLQHWRKVN